MTKKKEHKTRTLEEIRAAWAVATAEDPFVIMNNAEGDLFRQLMREGRKESKPTGDILSTQFVDFVSPIDGSVISSKHKLREHEKQHDVVQVGNDLENCGNHGLTRDQSKQQQGNT